MNRKECFYIAPGDEAGIDLENTLFCGQAFAWKRTEDGFRGLINGRELLLRQRGTGLEAVCGAESLPDIVRYFDLDTDYSALYRGFPGDRFMREALAEVPGLRILRQPPYEALMSFILSANNNIRRITGMIDRLSREFGEQVGEELFAFPAPRALASAGERRLAELGLGYRAPYVAKTAAEIAENGLGEGRIRSLPIEEANRVLCEYPGVGPKVADCALVFGFGRYEAFPVDVWTARILKLVYGISEPSLVKTAGRARAYFGPHAGIAQQYLFHYSRRIGAEGLRKWCGCGADEAAGGA